MGLSVVVETDKRQLSHLLYGLHAAICAHCLAHIPAVSTCTG